MNIGVVSCQPVSSNPHAMFASHIINSQYGY